MSLAPSFCLVALDWDFVFSGDAICEYESDEAFDAARASNTILLNIPETEGLYDIVDINGTVFYQDNVMERGWRGAIDVILGGAMAEVQPDHVHPGANHLFEQRGVARGGAEGGNDFCGTTGHGVSGSCN